MTRIPLADFKKRVPASLEEMCRDHYRTHREIIQVKKESVAVRNLVAIVNATLRLSSEKGFDHMSLRDLSHRSGLSLGTLYAYFAGKDDLLQFIQRQGQRMIEEILRESLQPEIPPRVRLARAIRTHLYLSELMRPWFYFFFMETRHLNRESRQIPLDSELFTEKVLMDILQEGQSEGAFSPGDAVLMASIIKAMMQDWYLKRWKYARRRISVETYGDFIIGVVESYILPKAAAAQSGGEHGKAG